MVTETNPRWHRTPCWSRARTFIVGVVTLAGCAPASNSQASTYSEAGFWHGVWHGFGIVGFLVASLFQDVGIYEIHNTGFGYNIGFVLGLIAFVGVLGVLVTILLEGEDGFIAVPALAILAILAVGMVQLVILGFALWLSMRDH